MSQDERWDRALEKIVADQSPRNEAAGLGEQEQRMLRMAQLIRGSAGQDIDPGFAERLHDRVFPQPKRVSRRTAFLSSLGALAAGLVAGIGVDRSTGGSPSGKQQMALVPANRGRWIPVATVADVPEGAVRAFTAGSVQGFVINRRGNLRALSRICTHMGCTLNFDQHEQAFVCPCHGAEFGMHGNVHYGPKGYHLQLPPLSEIEVRVNGQSVEVWSV